jgi:hypothetical protein
MTKSDMMEIVKWLMETVPSYKPPSDTSKQKVSDSDYLLCSLLIKPHLSEKGQSSHGIDLNTDPMAPLIDELRRLGTVPSPADDFVGACLFTCHEFWVARYYL